MTWGFRRSRLPVTPNSGSLGWRTPWAPAEPAGDRDLLEAHVLAHRLVRLCCRKASRWRSVPAGRRGVYADAVHRGGVAPAYRLAFLGTGSFSRRRAQRPHRHGGGAERRMPIGPSSCWLSSAPGSLSIRSRLSLPLLVACRDGAAG
jgi:hypothetical protein